MEKLPYKNDDWLYAFWKLLNGERLIRRDLARFEDFTAPEKGVNFAAMMMCQDLGSMNLELNGLQFHLDLYKKYLPKVFEGTTGFIELDPDVGVSKSVNKIFSGDFGLKDVENACMFQHFQLVEWFEFETKLPKRTHTVIAKVLDRYIDDFIKDELAIERINFLRFEQQKNAFFRELDGFYLNKFGKTFIYKTHVPNPLIELGEIDLEKLFIHTLIALERLEYLTIEEIWVYDMDLPPEKQTENYKVRMTVKPKLIEEVRDAWGIFPKKKALPSKNILTFDEGKSLLHFQGKEIRISRNGNTNPHHLLKTIFKDHKRMWSYDEIAEDWEEEYGKDDWNTYYYAAYSVNEKVAKKTGVDDFLIPTKTNVVINEKYR